MSTSKFDPAKLRLTQSYSEMVGVVKRLDTVPVQKPSRHEFIRIHTGEDYRWEMGILELKAERESYIVTPEMCALIPDDVVRKIIFTTINRQKVLKLWAIRLPDENGKLDLWNQSALDGAKLGETNWVCIASNLSLGAYQVREAKVDYGEPDWPELEPQNILEIAFKDKIIDSLDHHVLKKIRGEI